MLNNKQYDIIKYICCIGLPAIATAIIGLGAIYNFVEIAEMIAKTISVVQVLLGSLFCISIATYKGDDVN